MQWGSGKGEEKAERCNEQKKRQKEEGKGERDQPGEERDQSEGEPESVVCGCARVPCARCAIRLFCPMFPL